MDNTLIKDYTKGPIAKQLITFVVPLFLANLLQIIYNIADMIIVGNVIGRVGLSAVSVGGDVSQLLTFMIMGFANAAQVIISQYIGAEQRYRIGKFIGTFISFTFICVIVLTGLCLILQNQIILWMQTPLESQADAKSYFVTCAIGLVFIFGYNAISAIMRGLGDSKRPFVFIAIASMLNIGLDLLFVYVFGMRAFGAALATVISQGVSFIIGIGYLWWKRANLGFEMHLRYIRFNKGYLGPLVKLGIPMAIKHSSVNISRMFVNSFLNSYGLVVSAVVGIVGKITSVAMLISNAFNTAGSSMVGQNIGAEKYDRVLKILGVMLVIILPIYLVVGAIMFIFPEQIYSIFTSDSEVISIAMQYLPVWILIFAGFALRAPVNAFMNGTGNFTLNFLLAILDAVIMRIGLSLLLGLAAGWGYMGFWYGDAIAGFTPLAIFIVYLSTGKWKTRKYIIKE
ncbi:MAG: MATE family efflux transporter [Parasporobacterium sp.]|nr:MATE family efflux transporter [Parasporobacterium sp.]